MSKIDEIPYLVIVLDDSQPVQAVHGLFLVEIDDVLFESTIGRLLHLSGQHDVPVDVQESSVVLVGADGDRVVNVHHSIGILPSNVLLGRLELAWVRRLEYIYLDNSFINQSISGSCRLIGLNGMLIS